MSSRRRRASSTRWDVTHVWGVAPVSARNRRAKVRSDLGSLIPDDAYQLHVRVYGRDGVMGELEPHHGPPPHEVGLVIEVVADTQEIANTICALTRCAVC